MDYGAEAWPSNENKKIPFRLVSQKSSYLPHNQKAANHEAVNPEAAIISNDFKNGALNEI